MRIILLGLVAVLPACGISPYPMIERPSPERYGEVTAMWGNMMGPPGRLSRETLLDAVLLNCLHTQGVDRVSFRSEKEFAEGRVVMEVFYEYATPGRDRFELRVYDKKEALVRHESFSREDVEGAVRGTEPRLPPTEVDSPAYRAAKEKVDRRVVEAQLATRPAEEARKLREAATREQER